MQSKVENLKKELESVNNKIKEKNEKGKKTKKLN
jgi:hypothetical protein